MVKEGNVLLRAGYGLANMESKTSNNPETIFRIGSITKQFTATAILKLAEQGKLSLEDDITKFLPDYPTQGKKITITHLLTHTSGIKSYTSLPEVMTKEAKGKPVAVSDMINVFKDKPMDFNPGDDYNYNNSGYFLLGAIVEKASGMSWGEYLKKNFFGPLKMNSTYTHDPSMNIQAVGYNKGSSADFSIADYVHPSVPYSAGAIFSTIDDLWKWDQAIFSNKVVKKEFLDKAWTPLKLNDGRQESYGFGWQLGRLIDLRVIGHGGSIDGFVSFALYIPEKQVFVTVLANTNSVRPEEIAYRIAYLAAGLPAQEPQAAAWPEDKLEEYTGVYQINEKEDFMITRQGVQLFAQRTGGVKSEIFPYGEDNFFFKDSRFRIKFLRDVNKKILAAESKNLEYLIKTYKKTDKELPKERTTIQLDTARFDTYVGSYELMPGFIITIRRIGNKFFGKPTGQTESEIFPESETKFFLKEIDAQVEFSNPENGKTKTMILYQGGRTISGNRVEGTEQKQRVAISLDPATYDQFNGDYELAPGFIVTVRREDNKLMAQVTNQPSVEIFPESPLKFFYKVVDAQLEFSNVENGKANIVTLYQNGRILPGKRVAEGSRKKSENDQKPRVAISLDPATYDQFNGEYELTPGLIITVYREGNKLMAQVTGQPSVEIFPESPLKFFYKVVDAQIEFVKDESGLAKSLTLYQGGKVLPGKKIK